MNPFYDHENYPQNGSPGSSAAMRAELQAIETGFDKVDEKIEDVLLGTESFADQAEASAAAALVSANNADISEANALASADASALSASQSATSAMQSATSASNSAMSAAEALATKLIVDEVYDDFDDRYLGAKAIDPMLDNDGNPLMEGTLYYNTTSKLLKYYNGTVWVNAPAGSAVGTTFTPSGNIIATNVQAAIEELDLEKANADGSNATGTWPINIDGNASTAISALSANTAATVSDGAITTDKLATSAVTTAKVAAQAITLSKLARVGTAGQVLTSGGASADPAYQDLVSPPSDGRLLNYQVFTTSATYDKTIHNPSFVGVAVLGGGGRGGGVNKTDATDRFSAGGGGGGYARKLIYSNTLNNSEPITVGAEASTTSFGVHCSATGGASVSTNGTVGGNGGVGIGGDVNVTGQKGQPSASGHARHGGDSFYGRGEPSPTSGNVNGNAAQDKGAGGSGTARTGTTGSHSGGAGGSGLVIVWEYA
jgi:hypothetical protein